MDGDDNLREVVDPNMDFTLDQPEEGGASAAGSGLGVTGSGRWGAVAPGLHGTQTNNISTSEEQSLFWFVSGTAHLGL